MQSITHLYSFHLLLPTCYCISFLFFSTSEFIWSSCCSRLRRSFYRSPYCWGCGDRFSLADIDWQFLWLNWKKSNRPHSKSKDVWNIFHTQLNAKLLTKLLSNQSIWTINDLSILKGLLDCNLLLWFLIFFPVDNSVRYFGFSNRNSWKVFSNCILKEFNCCQVPCVLHQTLSIWCDKKFFT